ncbi:epoxyqueuosine reductase [Halobacteriovorax sp.]|uniref:epoxyqueuosine reductase n=1 Tax=Halobacteriovorax sp. TaxID=2020862 RepID=UPI00356485E2
MKNKILEEVLHSKNLSQYGIVDWGVTTVSRPITWKYYFEWVNKGLNGILKYLEGERRDKREDLKNYYPEFKSAIVFQFSYAKKKFELDKFYKSKKSNGLKIASYVLGFDGIDYHFNLRESLNQLGEQLREIDPELNFKLSLDTQPILERDLAFRAGLGWFGKNSMFISKKEGSFFILGSLLLSKNYSLNEKVVETDHCGQCTRCADSCPTDAIDLETRTLIADKCISTYTIEQFKDIGEAPKGMESSNGEIFGCDICQEVCPWNKRLLRIGKYDNEEVIVSEKEAHLREFFLERPLENILDELKSLSNRGFQRLFKSTPIERTGRIGLLKNIRFFYGKR